MQKKKSAIHMISIEPPVGSGGILTSSIFYINLIDQSTCHTHLYRYYIVVLVSDKHGSSGLAALPTVDTLIESGRLRL